MRLGKYQLLRKLATGGMAEVFLAKTDGPMGFEKMLVIKRILPHLAEDPQFVEMFLGEAKLAAQLNHPNLVQLFDFGEAEGAYFIAMEYIDGPTLRLLLARSRDLRTPISLALAARLVSSAAEGLAYAHDFRDHVTGVPLHLVHRDVSPDNILVSRSGSVKLVDFGIAKARGQSHHTQAGTVKGKVAYMAPEQLRGEPLDRRVDLYSLGVVLYELCTGRMPFEANSDASMVRAVLYDAAIPAVKRVPTLPRALQGILERLLAKDRKARYPDCRTLHADLEAFIQSSTEPTNGFALSRLVVHLAPPAPPAPPAQPLPPPVPAQVPPGVTASAFAPTSSSPVLLSEPSTSTGRAAASDALEILDLDRTVRAEPRRMPPPPVANLEVRAAASAAPRPSPGAFVFPTALETERGTVAPVRLGLDRHEGRRRTTGITRQVRSEGGVLRLIGVLLLFAVLAVVGAYLGLAAAHRTDLLARVGLPVPGALAPAASGAPPAAAPVATPTPAEAAPGTKPAPVAEARPPATGAQPSGTASPPVAENAPVAPPAAPVPAPPTPLANTPRPEASGAAAPPEASAAPNTAGATTVPAPGKASEPRTASKPATTGSTEADREKLLGAFAQLEAAKESTVRLESTPKMRVRMGGKLLGPTPVTLTIPAQEGPVELEFFDTALGLSKPEQLTLKPGDNGTHKVVIPRGKLVLKLQDDVVVSVDGKTLGTTPLAPISLYEGSHVVQLTRGELKERRTLEITGDEETDLEFSFPEEQ